MRMRRMRRVLRRLPLLALVVEGPLLALVVDGHGDRARLSASEAVESWQVGGGLAGPGGFSLVFIVRCSLTIH